MRITPLLTTILCAGCASSTAPVATVRVQTEASHVTLGAPVAFTAVNPSHATLFLASCGERVMTAIDRWQQGQWQQYSGDGCRAIYPMVPQALAPDATYAGAASIREPGRYRLRLGVGVAPNSVEWTAVSNPFDIQ